MSEVLYRKWRPQRLDQVVGQEPVTSTLRRAVSLGRVAHAFILCGPRGTGKTSTARILAKAVNCLSPQDGEPDNECEICRSISEGRALDLIEIDAASNRGIDDIRNLSDKIHFSPTEARYKVYIIDEVHMLTDPAFNALLKTLEEPPDHAIFVLATTEAHKVPLTIVSRCQRFDFRRIPLDRTVEKLSEICNDEDVEADDEALRLIARSATGSLRDAENMLEQVIVSYGSPITGQQVRDMLDLGGEEEALELVGHIVNKSVAAGLKVINDVVAGGHDLRQLHRGVTELLRAILLLKSGAPASLSYQEDMMARLNELSKAVSMDHLVRALKAYANVDMRRDSSTPLPLELALVECSTAAPAQPETELAPAPRQPRRQESRGQGERAPTVSKPSPSPVTDVAPRCSSTAQRPAARTEAPPAVPAGPVSEMDGQWDMLVRGLRHTGKRFKLGALFRGCKGREIGDGLITLKFLYTSHVERVEQELADPDTLRELQDVLTRVMGERYEVRASLVDAEDRLPSRGAGPKSPLVRVAQAMGARVVDDKEED